MSDIWDSGEEDVLPQSDRLQILSPEEYELLWGLPRFSEADRDLFFALTLREETLIERLRTPRTKLHFLLQLGYFRARQRFFQPDVESIRDDLNYLSRRYLTGTFVPDLNVSLHTRQQHIHWILELFGYRLSDQEARLALEARALRAARISSRPLYVLRDLVDHFRRQRIVLPGYTYLQDVVGRAGSFERHRLSEALKKTMTVHDEALLDGLLSDDDGLHAVTSLKHHPRDFSLHQLLAEIERGYQSRDLFDVAKRIIAQAWLSVESVRFYASLVDYYTVYKLKRMNPAMAQLYLLCFVHDRYQRLNDHLLSAFCALVRRYSDEVAEATKESVYQHKRQATDDLDQGVKILELFLDPTLPDEMPFANVRARARSLLPSDRLARLCEHLSGDGSLDESAYEWEAVDTVMPKVKRNLRPLLRFLSLSGTPSQATLLSVIETLAEAFREGRHLPAALVSTTLIPERYRRYLAASDGSLIRDRYEYLIYRQLRDRLEAGDLFCADSARFRSFEDDLVDEDIVAQKTTLLPQVGLAEATVPIKQQMAALRDALNERFETVNARIRRGENRFVQVRNGQTVWARGHDADEPARHEPLFDAAERVDIDQLLLHVDKTDGLPCRL